MEALALDPDGYTGTYKLIGGRLALDFINTVSWPGTERSHDWFTTAGNVENWLSAVGLEPASIDADDLADIAELRTTVTQALRPLGHGRRPTVEAVAAFNVVAGSAASRRQIDPASLQWSWPTASNPLELFDPVVLDAADILTDARRERLKHCPACDWVFEDHTRNGKRRWCDMADCGSRAKSRSHYQRSRSIP